MIFPLLLINYTSINAVGRDINSRKANSDDSVNMK